MSALICDLPADYCGDERYAVTGKGVRFGMTTEAALFAKHTLVLAPGEEKCVTFVLGCGDKNELNALCRTVRDQGFGEYCISAARSVPEELVMPAAFSDVAGAIISGGQINGAPPRINIIASRKQCSVRRARAQMSPPRRVVRCGVRRHRTMQGSVVVASNGKAASRGESPRQL